MEEVKREYKREELLHIGKRVVGSAKTYKVPQTTWKTIQELGLGSRIKTKRGSRGGRKKQKATDTNHSSNKENKLK